MATNPIFMTSKKRKEATKETSRSIEEQTRAFLKAGGKINYIKSGVSGQQNLIKPKLLPLETKKEG